MRAVLRTTLVVGAATAMSLATPLAANASCPSGIFKQCENGETGALLLTGAQVLALEKYPEDAGGALVHERPPDAPRYDYMSLNDCGPARPETPTEQVSCAHALRDCPEGEVGPLLRIWRRTLEGATVTESWMIRGLTCAAGHGTREHATFAGL